MVTIRRLTQTNSAEVAENAGALLGWGRRVEASSSRSVTLSLYAPQSSSDLFVSTRARSRLGSPKCLSSVCSRAATAGKVPSQERPEPAVRGRLLASRAKPDCPLELCWLEYCTAIGGRAAGQTAACRSRTGHGYWYRWRKSAYACTLADVRTTVGCRCASNTCLMECVIVRG